MKLKKQFEGHRITRTHPQLGTLTFDSEINNESEYRFYYNNGFSDLFETEPKAYKGVEHPNKNGASKKD